jgi:hypothetical protein
LPIISRRAVKYLPSHAATLKCQPLQIIFNMGRRAIFRLIFPPCAVLKSDKSVKITH